MKNRGTSLLVTLAVAATTLMMGAPAHGATFTWSSQPLVNLKAEGAVINGGITNFPTKSGLYIQQCAAPATAGERPSNCLDLAWVSKSGMQGTVLPTGVITFTLKANINGRQGPINCLTSECGLFFRLDHFATADKSEDTYMKISFAAPTSALQTLATDSITLTLDGKTLVKNVPVNLAYRAPAKVTAAATSGLPVTVTSATPECSYSAGVITALKGSGLCALNVSTAGSTAFDPARANFPFTLTPGTQTLSLTSVTVERGKSRKLPTETNFGESISYSSDSKNCRIAKSVVRVTGSCVLTATAPAKEDMWSELNSTVKVRVSKKK